MDMLMLLHNMTLIKKTKNRDTCLTLSLSLLIISYHSSISTGWIESMITWKEETNSTISIQMLKLLTQHDNEPVK